ncbi:S8 family serine peptidase [Pseudohalioglobus lutimaris]|uniref:S8 family serine peptidase n=1 Tax=Pseudohalioglobus lutimaris TaxID=1737061 RepID=UPI001E2F6B8C|nr:S8 family serine peptidase [Pseudohalioglobus lutimaris]
MSDKAVGQVPGSLDGSNIIEDQVEEEVEDSVEDAVDDTITDAAEEGVEEAVEDQLDELLLGPGDRFVEDKVEEQVEDAVQEEIEDVVEEVAEEEVQDTLEDAVEEQITDTVTEEVEDDVEQEVEEEVEQTVADNVEDTVEDQIEESVQQEVAQNVEENLESGVEESVEQTVEQSVETEVETTVESAVEVAVEENVEQVVEASAEIQVADAVEERLENEIDDILDDLESDLEVDEERIHREQWLVMAEPEVFEELAEKGYLFDTVTDLPGLGMRLAEVAGPSSFDITEVRRGVLDVVGKDRAEVDLNHIYTAGSEVAVLEEGIAPRAAIGMTSEVSDVAPRIGMIDSRVDTTHPALASASIESRSFVSPGAQLPDFHGTAIASIIAANDGQYQGLMPAAQVYAAAVFEQDEERGEIASTVSLLRALDWLISTHVDVVNISLAGPPNRLLETALQRAAQQNVLVMAAAGNGGPVAKPMYPAAYDTVVAVTAVDGGHKVFRLANRGEYLDIAAPGVGLLHARAGGGYAASSGTSFAVPFAAAAAANLRKLHPGADVMALLYQSAEDLGPPGRDEIYGYGLLRFGES